MQTATVSFRFRCASASHCVLGLTLATAIGCGGSEVGGDSTDPTPSGGAASSPAASAAQPSQSAASSDSEPSPAPNAAGPDAAMASPTPNEGGSSPASIDAAGVGAACAELGTEACGACVCRECGAELDTCANTPGCPEILACVRDKGCSGTDCFCGDAALPRCFTGGGDGPCKGVVLSAPGGREPTLDNPSAGPASDAALDVGECADGGGCADVCDVGL